MLFDQPLIAAILLVLLFLATPILVGITIHRGGNWQQDNQEQN